jgi:hypothetical protein
MLALGGCRPGQPSAALPLSVAQGVETLSTDPTVSAHWQLETADLDHATLYWLTIPKNAVVSVAVADSLATVDRFATETDAQAVLNAGFFDPQNQQTTSHIVIHGERVGDPAENARLVGNPDLAPYLDQILNRSEFRRYDCAGQPRYDITFHDAPVPAACQLVDSVGAGPQLLPENLAEAEAFTAYANGTLIRDALGSQQRNARTAVGIREEGQVVWVMVAQNPEAPAGTGLTLAELAQWMAQHGIQKALNLDGGSSSSLFFQGKTYGGRYDADGNPVTRPVKSVLVVRP